ncbi:hypothetical protein [Streptomyces sp. NBC_00892]|uniref:hypothetical protein n=1 Tax=Streptomyces sp. NBC_00892 TaxID=2975861 RepID=UPI0022518A05|nr:hypothetical protein [Streptomyces sp. NBC_00892]MCX4902385.1 hypothetical protein [Streptomyces sp. NBC_00892]
MWRRSALRHVLEVAERQLVRVNPHLLVSAQTALDPTGPPIGKTLLRNAIGRTGLTARALWQDRILAEAHHSADPVRLIRLFAIADSTAMRYVQAAHPEKPADYTRDSRRQRRVESA